MTQPNQFQLSAAAAESYESHKVPAIFGPMADATLDAITLPASARVLDVACGTGAVARAVSSRLTQPSHLSGADLNPAMIEMARNTTPAGIHSFDWAAASVEDMPFADGVFDLAFCQQGLQFFPDKGAALAEIRRCLQPGGRLILTTWAAIPPFFEVVRDVLHRHLSPEAAATAVRPFVWNDSDEIRSIISAGGFECADPKKLQVFRKMPADVASMREEILATPNEPALRAVGDTHLDAIVEEILAGVSQFRSQDTLVMPQTTYLFEGVAI